MIKISDELIKRVNETLSELGFKLYYVDQEVLGSDFHVIIYVQNKKQNLGVSLEDCVIITRQINKYIDNYIKEDYILEISSPGINRQLYTIEHYEDAINSTVEVKLLSSVEGIKGKKITGVLEKIDDENIFLSGMEIPLKKIKKVLYIGEKND